MTVGTVYRKAEGKVYHIISRSGSTMLQSRVFDRLLREEGEMSRGEARRQTLVNSQNYVIHSTGEEICSDRKCYVVELTPRTASAHLIKGRAWIDAQDGSLIRIEGKPTASPSFLAGRPLITRDYEKVGDFWLAKRSHAQSESLFFGQTDLQIEYVDYHIDAVERANPG